MADLNMSVVCVDDNVVNRMVARAFLEAAGAIITEAADGAELLDAVDASRADIVLLDLFMPRMDGRAALTALRAREGKDDAPPLPVIVLTADASADSRRELMALGGRRLLDQAAFARRPPFRSREGRSST